MSDSLSTCLPACDTEQETARLVDYVGGGGGSTAATHRGVSVAGSMTPGRFVGGGGIHHSAAAAMGGRLGGSPGSARLADYAPGSHIAATIQQHASQVCLGGGCGGGRDPDRERCG